MDANEEKDIARVRAVLAEHGGVTERKMMGRLAFMVNGAMCCSTGRDGLLVRVDAASREEVLAKPHVMPMELGSRTMSGFVRVAPEGYRTGPALRKWIELGIAAGASKRKARPGARAKRRG